MKSEDGGNQFIEVAKFYAASPLRLRIKSSVQLHDEPKIMRRKRRFVKFKNHRINYPLNPATAAAAAAAPCYVCV